MKIFAKRVTSFLFVCLTSVSVLAQISNLEADLGDSYYYVDHFETVIDKPAQEVWPHVIKMGEWLPWIGEIKSISEGDKIHLYGDSYIEVVKIIPQKMVMLANLPNTDKGEESQGVVMVSISEANGKTIVSIFMSRIHNWFSTEENPQRITRSSEAFSANRKTTFKDNALAKLKLLAEAQ